MYEDEWLTNPLSVKMIADVDKSTVIGNHLIESPCFGTDISEETVWRRKNINTNGSALHQILKDTRVLCNQSWGE